MQEKLRAKHEQDTLKISLVGHFISKYCKHGQQYRIKRDEFIKIFRKANSNYLFFKDVYYRVITTILKKHYNISTRTYRSATHSKDGSTSAKIMGIGWNLRALKLFFPEKTSQIAIEIARKDKKNVTPGKACEIVMCNPTQVLIDNVCDFYGLNINGDICILAKRICIYYMKLYCIKHSDPRGVASGCVYLASNIIDKIRITQIKLAEFFGITDVTLRTYYQTFRDLLIGAGFIDENCNIILTVFF